MLLKTFFICTVPNYSPEDTKNFHNFIILIGALAGVSFSLICVSNYELYLHLLYSSRPLLDVQYKLLFFFYNVVGS